MGSALLPLMWGWAIAAHRVVSRELTAGASSVTDHEVAVQRS